MKKTYYVIQLINDEFASFDQESVTDICVLSWEESELYNADFFYSEESAKHAFDDLMSSNSSWYYYGECLKPKAIRKIELQLY